MDNPRNVLNLRLRTLQLLARLASCRGLSAPRAQLAEELDVHERTLRRDVQELQQLAELLPAGLPFELPVVRTEHREDGRAWLVLERASPTVAEVYQYAAVYSAVSHLRALDPAVLGASAEQVLEHLAAAADADTVARVRRAFYYRPFGPKDYNEEALDALEEVVFGIWYRRPLRVRYRALGTAQPREHELEPYTLVLHRDGFYVLGQLGGKPRPTRTLLALSRIEAVERDESRTFEVPADFDPDTELGQSFGIWRSEAEARAIVLAFESDAARTAAERRWPGSDGWRALPDGREALHLSLPITPDLVVWILSWRDHVEVVAPDELRAEVITTLERMLGRYRTPHPTHQGLHETHERANGG